MKINGKSILITFALLLVLSGVALVEISLFISGPARKSEQIISDQEAKIKSKYKDMKSFDRHVFYYTTYVGKDDDRIIWFNELGKPIVAKKKKTLQLNAVKDIAKTSYGATNVDVSLGYGYDNPVYVIESDAGSILLDYDTLKEVYFLKEGDA